MRRARRIAIASLLLLAGCGYWTERKLQGAWETEATPKRMLELRPDKSYSRRFSGKTLGFLSDLAGPEQGTWRVEGEQVVLFSSDGNKERSEKLVIKDLTGDSAIFGGERYRRVTPSVPSPAP